MPWKLCLRPVLLALLLIPAAAWAGQQWQPYVNDRFGTGADIPQGWTAGTPPENSDGLTWTSPDGAAKVAVWGGLQVEDTLAEAFAIVEKPDDGETVTYRAKGAHSLVLSGVKGEDIFYERLLLSCKDTVWNGVRITYPRARKAEFDPIVARIAKSLHGGTGFQTESCK